MVGAQRGAPVMIEAQDTLFTPMSVPSATGAVIIVGSEAMSSGQR